MAGHKGQKRNKEDWAHMKLTRLTNGNPNWKGKSATIGSIHCWVRRNWSSMPSCEICGALNDGSITFDWSNKDHKYSRERTDWQHVCRSCHNIYDQKHNGRDLSSGPSRKFAWSRDYERCVDCGRNNVKHKGLGRCSKCLQIHLGVYEIDIAKRTAKYHATKNLKRKVAINVN